MAEVSINRSNLPASVSHVWKYKRAQYPAKGEKINWEILAEIK